MAAEKDKADDEQMPAAGEQGSGTRIKRDKPGVRAIFSDFVHRTEGVTEPEFEREFEHLLDRIVERNLGVVPEEKRDEVRDVIRSYIENDPRLAAMVSKLRAAARR